MATQARDNFDFDEQRVRILRTIEEVQTLQEERLKLEAERLRMEAERLKAHAEVEFMPRSMIFKAMLASAALLGAGAAIAKLFFP